MSRSQHLAACQGWAAGALLLFSLTSATAQQRNAARAADQFAEAQTAAAIAKLSSPAQVVLNRLAGLSTIPLTQWRFHIGDVAHGASLDFDDSSWPLLVTPHQTTTTDTIWLRTVIDLPRTLSGYDLTGASVRIPSWKNNAVTIYLNGQRVAGGDDLEPILLFSHAQPGDSALLAVRIEKSEDPQYLPDTTLQLSHAAGRPDPSALYTEFVTAALLTPDLSLDRPTLEKAIGDVDLQALDNHQQTSFDQSLRQAQADLQPLQAALSTATFHLTGNAHIDAAWLWPWSETVDVVRRTFATVLQLMQEYPDFTYTQSAVQYNQWIADKYPEMNQQIRQRIQQGRWEVVGGMWVEPDLNMPGGESLVRQLLIGQRTLQQLYGVTTRVGWNPDSFGYNWQLPQIYKKSGIDYFVTQKMAWNETNPLPLKLFWWQSPDGSRVLTYFPHSYGNEDLNPVRLANDLVKARSLAPGLLELMDLYGVGDHGGGPTRAMLDEGTGWGTHDQVVPRMQFGTAQSFFTNIEPNLDPRSPIWNYQTMAASPAALPAPTPGNISIPTWNDELYFEHHRGTYTTQATQKRNMRASEEWMLRAEMVSSLAWLDGAPYPTSTLNDAWKKVLFNQFHDLAAGSGIATIYKDAQQDYDQVRLATDAATAQAMQTIQAGINTRLAGSTPVLVFNALGWPRSGLVEVDVQMPELPKNGLAVLDHDNRVLPTTVLSTNPATARYRLLVQVSDVPSFGYSVLHVVPGKRPFASDLQASNLTLENSRLKVVVDAQTGCITSLYDKQSHVESLAPGACGNQLQAFHDDPTGDDAWNIDPGTLDHVIPILQVDSVKLLESGPLRSVIRVARTWQNSTFLRDITLVANSDQVEVVNDFDWHETHTLLKVAFPLAASSSMATYEIPYGTIERPTTRDNSWEQAKFEVPSLRFADLGNAQHGFSLLNEAKYGYDCKGNVLRLTLLRSPLSPDPTADRGRQTFRYALYPHSADWKTARSVQHGYEYNQPLEALQVGSHTGSLPLQHSFFQVDERNIILTAIKKAEDGNGIILHLYEYEGKNGTVTVRVPKEAVSAALTNLMEKPEGPPLPMSEGKITLPVHAYEIVSLQVNYPER